MEIEFKKAKKVVQGETHIHETDLTIQGGTFNVLLGPTLSGKTSLIRLMAGLDKATSGEVLVDGVNVNRIPLQKRNIGMVYQEFINYPSFTVYDNIASPLKLKKLSKSEIDKKVQETAEMLGLEKFLDRFPSAMSGGQQQRLALARAFVKDTNLLLLDEPLVNLDYKLREKLREDLLQMMQKEDRIVIYATTDPLEALTLGGNTIVLHEGQVLQSGPALDVFHKPTSTAAALNFSDPPMNLLKVDVFKKEGKSFARFIDKTEFPLEGHLSELREGIFQFGFRCTHGSIFSENQNDVEINGEVELAELTGAETFVHARHGGMTVVVHEEGTHSHRLGEAIKFYIQAKHLYAFDQRGDLVVAPPHHS